MSKLRFANWMIACALSLAGCGRVEPLIEGIGDAENAVFTDDGRLFVSGGENVYEVIAMAGAKTARPRYDGKCNFTGIAVRRGHVYSVCVSGEVGASPAYLLGAPLAAEPSLQIIHEFAAGVTPNGIAFAADDRLFVADSTVLQSQLLVITLDAQDPLAVVSDSVWLTGFAFLNGLRYWDGKLYGTDLTNIVVIPIAEDGMAGAASVLTSGLAVFDDLLPTTEGILVTDFLGGRVMAYSFRGRLLAQTPAVFDSPSSVVLGRPPLVPNDALVVTEKGEIGELTSNRGNRVSVFIPEE